MNTVAIPTTGKSCSLYWELLHPILEIPLASIGKLPLIGNLPIQACTLIYLQCMYKILYNMHTVFEFYDTT